ncbi:HsdM family class I SAM-dependent methyltransferase [Paraclostridium bifermentans]|uniref:HsdM family class I SAM-dependent methyltransferase n=1 Tax=Paraclostridium bifermentans TaxID=1490 RepID=UPI001FF1E120|nr:N-6 DNA methylase [Paraclostridium bifermentans]UOW69056.1 SAM-dependent methyltransferase [Paraclostridium bifermentans]
MNDLKDKVKRLGYENINDIDENTFMAIHKDICVYVKKVDEDQLTQDVITSITYDAMSTDPMSTYAWITNGSSNAYVLVIDEKSIAEIPPVIKVETGIKFGRRELTYLDKWSIEKYQDLQEKFDAAHEMIYNMKDHVNNSNDAIDEFCKLIYMEVFRLSHEDYVLREGSVAGKKLDDIFSYKNIEASEDKNQAVQDIREAFKEIKNHEDYVAVLDNGDRAPIFSPDEYIKLENPTIYTTVLEILQNLGEVEIDDVKRPGTLLDLTGDVAGRVFDVLLRGKFENKGGMGIYLTPRQVTEAGVEMVLHDLTKDGAAKLIQKDPKTGYPTFKVGDTCCGSAGFVIKMLQEIRSYLLTKLSGDKKQHEEIFELMKEHSFIGADASPGMVLKARLNMAMNGAPKCPIFQTRNSLTSENLEPGTFDAIITNPPFAKGGVSKTIAKGKTKVENPEGIEIIKMYSSDIDEDKQNRMTADGLSLGSKPDSKGKWKEVNSIDPAVLFIDRNLQLLKPGGLLMMVIPDGILSNSGEKHVRDYIMGKKNSITGDFEGGKAIVKAVISLPKETFELSGAGAKTSLLYLKKKEHQGEKQGPIFMSVANSVGFIVKKNVEIQLGDDYNDLLKIVDIYKQGMDE